MKEGNDKLTISVNEEIKEKYKEFCDKNGLKIGKQIELFMENELRKISDDKNKNNSQKEKGGKNEK